MTDCLRNEISFPICTVAMCLCCAKRCMNVHPVNAWTVSDTGRGNVSIKPRPAISPELLSFPHYLTQHTATHLLILLPLMIDNK